MDVNKKDKITRAYSRLVALRKNTPEQVYVDEEWVGQYQQALQHLADLGFDIDEFKIPEQWLKNRVAVSGPGRTRYRKEREVHTSKFLSKLDAAVEYFSISTSTPEGVPRKVIGFAAPEK
jgi:hypothetical protein